MNRWDIVVVGAGNAGMTAAHAARETGARVLVTDAAPERWAGGNTYFTAGAFRTSHPGSAGGRPGTAGRSGRRRKDPQRGR